MLSCNPLDRIQALGIDVAVHDGKLRLTPSEKVTDAVRHIVQEHRAAIISALANQTTPYTFLARHDVMLHLPDVGDVWLVSDEQAAGTLKNEGLPVLFEKDTRWILQVRGHEARLERLRAIFERRHRLTKTVLETFPGAKVSSTKPMRVQP